MDRMYKTFKERPIQTAIKAFIGITLPSILLWYSQKDDPAYQELPTWRKTLFWNIVVRDKEGKLSTIIALPKPFEWGLLFGSIPESILDWLYTKNPMQINKNLEQIMSSFNFLPVPTAVVAPVENWANRSAFFDRNIVPRDKEGLDPYLQYGGRTSETVKLATRLMNEVPGLKEIANPSKIENLINGYTGGAGRLALGSSDWLLKTFGVVKTPPDPAMTLSDIPGARAFTARFPSSSSRSIEQFYSGYTKEKQKWESAKEVAGIRGAGIEEINKQNETLTQMEAVASVLSLLRKVSDSIYKDVNLTPKAKRDALDNNFYAMITLARGYYGKPPIANKFLKE
jgi:hypothetical protein